MFGRNPDVRVSDTHAVVMHVRKRYDEGNNSENQNQEPYDEQRFHTLTPKAEIVAGLRVGTRPEPSQRT